MYVLGIIGDDGDGRFGVGVKVKVKLNVSTNLVDGLSVSGTDFDHVFFYLLVAICDVELNQC